MRTLPLNSISTDKNEWWRGSTIYQVYPRSFHDSNGDGIGDLAGITEKLPYIADLGVKGIWISPFFTSPMKDFGYDVSDYRDVDPMFGTLDDFKALLARAHALDIKIVIDLVLSHTSDQHPWFTEKPEYYVWADPKFDEDGHRIAPNNWVSVFGGSAWEWHEERGQYYLHNFLKEQPDLNFHNPDVRNEVLDIVKFWLDMGVNGLRLDVVNFYFHDQKLRNNPARAKELGAATQFEGQDPYSEQKHQFDKSRPENLHFLGRLRKLANKYGDILLLGEIGDDHPFQRAAQYTFSDQRLHTCYNPQMMAGAHKELSADTIRAPIQCSLDLNAWPSWAFSNHDVVRASSRWYEKGDGFAHDPRFSKMLNALLGSLYGTKFLYQGEELGLPEAKLQYEDLQDPWGKHLWPQWQGRDGCRTPMPWTKTLTEKSWLPVPEEHRLLNIADQRADKNSVLSFTQEFLKWANTQPALSQGSITFKDTHNEFVLSFRREFKDHFNDCVFNLSGQPQKIKGRTLQPYEFEVSGFSSPSSP